LRRRRRRRRRIFFEGRKEGKRGKISQKNNERKETREGKKNLTLKNYSAQEEVKQQQQQ